MFITCFANKFGEVIDFVAQDVMIAEFYRATKKPYYVPVIPLHWAGNASYVSVMPLSSNDEFNAEDVFPKTISIASRSLLFKLTHFDYDAALCLMPNFTLALAEYRTKTLRNKKRELRNSDFVEFYHVQPHLLFTTFIGRMIWSTRLSVHLKHGFTTADICFALSNLDLTLLNHNKDTRCDLCRSSIAPFYRDFDSRTKCQLCSLLLITIHAVGCTMHHFREQQLFYTNVRTFERFLFHDNIDLFD